MPSNGRGDEYTDFLDFLKRNPRVRRALFTDLAACIERYNGHDDDAGRPVKKFALHREEIRRLVHAWEHERPEERDERGEDEDEERDDVAKGWNM